ncbi:hypothetical protein I553_3535 [Mycobacterium xenopi 4042]|uniref:Uncharacterized protein n=1 Tax=Mycobacterium xenopi 4042 TaxID=1299334 RepID=X8AN12_MYCXE|nr:hypothetical protein I553_3535 [Mycobacterium xenopi 4042]
MPIVTMLLIAMVVALWKIRRRLVAGRDRAVRAVQAFTGRTTNTATSNIAAYWTASTRSRRSPTPLSA